MRVTRSSKAAAAKRNATPSISSTLKASKAGVVKNRKPTKSTLAQNGIRTEAQLASVSACRPVEPTVTSAPLVVEPKKETPVVSFPNQTKNAPTLTSNILEVAQKHLLAVEPKMAFLIEKHHCQLFSPESLAEPIDPFQSLASSIISQQVSGAAAKSIRAKVVALFEQELAEKGLSFPTPSMVLACDHSRLRSAGCSNRKAEYLHSLAQHFQNGDLTTEVLLAGSNDEIVEKLIQIRGIGAWSAQMFMMFSLKRMDVFSIGDLGIQRGMAAFAGKNVSKLKTAKGDKKWKYMSEADMLEMSEKFRPYRSLFMWYMWKASDTSVESLASDSKKPKPKVKSGKAKEQDGEDAGTSYESMLS